MQQSSQVGTNYAPDYGMNAKTRLLVFIHSFNPFSFFERLSHLSFLMSTGDWKEPEPRCSLTQGEGSIFPVISTLTVRWASCLLASWLL